jgi:hypothetical protein
MKTTILVKQEVNIVTLHVAAQVRYWDDSTVNGEEDSEDGKLIPCKEGELWCPIINVDSGVITNWEQGKKAEIHYKVCDAGSYYLRDAEGKTVLQIEQDYVPKMLCPAESWDSDYIIMTVDENGLIEDWKQTLDGFIKEQED